MLGFNQGTWDCFINQYEHYSWDELEVKGVQQHYVNLGWNEAFWTHDAEGVPYTEARWWDHLTDTEKRAANKAVSQFSESGDAVHRTMHGIAGASEEEESLERISEYNILYDGVIIIFLRVGQEGGRIVLIIGEREAATATTTIRIFQLDNTDKQQSARAGNNFHHSHHHQQLSAAAPALSSY